MQKSEQLEDKANPKDIICPSLLTAAQLLTEHLLE